MVRKTVLPACAAALLLASGAASAAPFYTITDLGDLPGWDDRSYANGVNDSGQVVGYSYAATGYRAFLWDSVNGMTDLGDLPGGGNHSFANGINDSGQVVGYSGAATGERAFLWENGVMTDLGDLPGGVDRSTASDINNSGQVVGYGYAATGYRAFRWDNGVMTDLGDLPGGTDQSSAHGINDGGQVVGYSAAATYDRAFLWDNGVMTDLGDLPGGVDISYAYGVNNNGQVVGFSSAATGPRAFLWDNGVMTDLGDLPGGLDSSYAEGINDGGQVVGQSVAAATSNRAFLWEAGSGMVNLNTLLVNPSDWVLYDARDINTSGQIVGYGTRNGLTHGFLLNPVTPDNPLLPSIDPVDGSFDFSFNITPDQQVFIDPVIAVGYDYIVNSGPNIASVLLPTVAGDDGTYELYAWNPISSLFDVFLDFATAGNSYDFVAGGVDRFRVLGIDEAALLDPTNPVAFVTGLTFVESGTVDMSMIPVTSDTDAVNPGPTGVPEPGTLLLLGAGLLALISTRRKSAAYTNGPILRPVIPSDPLV